MNGRTFSLISSVCFAAVSFSAEPVDKSKLPPAATRAVDFAKDIKPIFEASCVKCHGAEKQKGKMRLDNKADAMKGGDNGVDIVLGKSADSPLIHFVTRLVKDSEMPPDGKGDPMTKEQIGLLRAWIDQGAKWPETAVGKIQSPKVKAPNLAALPPPAKRKVDFARDIRPIFAASCYGCHGSDRQEKGLRLDIKNQALKGSQSGPVIIARKSAESRLIHLVAGIDSELVMPKKGDRLTAEQVGLLRAWIDQGAEWPDGLHWSFNAPKRPAEPKVSNKRWVRNPIDSFVLARLEKEKIKQSPEADRVTLIRRLSFDLRGLPPSLDEVNEFLADRGRDAYEKLVDRILASPHFGEHWGRHWLDLARYADSDGYEKDTSRPYAYLFRDWVIAAFNRDMPFDQFTIEQLAGDLLPNATTEQKIATAFHRQTLTNREGGVDKEEFRCKATVDRTSTTGTVWLGLTLGCCECHNHKYDPFTQKEFYQFYAFFNNASEKDIPAPQPAELAEYQKELKAWETKLAELEVPLDEYLKNDLVAKLAEWEKNLHLPAARWTVLTPKKVAVAVEGDETLLNAQPDHSVLTRDKDPGRSIYRVETDVPMKGITGFRLEAIAEPGKNVGRGKSGDFSVSEFVVKVHAANGELLPIKLARAEADFSSTNANVNLTIDGEPNTGWSIAPQTKQNHVAVFETERPLDLPVGAKLSLRLEHFTATGSLMTRFRLAATTSPVPLKPDLMPDAIVAILDTPAGKRTAKQKAQLTRYFAERIDPEVQQLNAKITAYKAKKPKAPETAAAILAADERKTHIHVRGDFLRPGDEVQPGTLHVLHPFKPRGAEADRLDLANWLTDPANPLTARVVMNRMWRHLFGRGLVNTVDDFGTRGDMPTHPELLDWLATEFPQRGWSQKAMIKLIVTSATYRQSSRYRPELAGRDPLNTLLSRQNRLRIEAENVRDAYLAASGLLTPAIGGPSIKPSLPPDLTKLNYANGMKWDESKGAEKYRRGLYIFFQRTVPYPMLMTFDAPESTTCCAKRERSNTPLQALTLLNDPVLFECAQALGKQLAAETAKDPKQRIKRAFEICLSRDPTSAEMVRVKKFYDGFLRMTQAHPENAAKIVGDCKCDAQKLPEAATLVAVGRAIMNLDEFVTRE